MAGGKTGSQSSLRDADFEAIEAAVMETARGRWFLTEFARRHRAADTDAVLEAIARIEARLAEPRTAPAAPRELASLPELDLTAVAEHLLRGEALDWPDPEPVAEIAAAPAGPEADDPWPPEDAEASPREADPAPEARVPEAHAAPEEEPARQPTVADEDIAAWEDELAALDVAPMVEQRAEVVSFVRVPESIEALLVSPLPAQLPPAHPAAPPAPLRAPVAKPAAARPAPPRPAVAANPERPPPKPGPRIDDPTLTMTRDEKLALFS
jgi:hypothetical protein